MQKVNWTSVIVAALLGGALVTIVVAGKEIPPEVKGTLAGLTVILMAFLKGVLEGKPSDPPPPQVTP